MEAAQHAIRTGCAHEECEGEPHCLDLCDHGVSYDDHHGCAECAGERAEALADEKREGAA